MPKKKRDVDNRVMNNDLSVILVIMAAIYLLGAPYLFAGWAGKLELPGSLMTLGGLLPYLALALAVGGAGILGVLQMKKWGAILWGLSWLVIWALLFISSRNAGLLISAAFSTFILVYILRPLWHQLS